MNNTKQSDRKVNVAVVGLGFMGTVHLRAYLQNPAARIVAVCDAVRVPVDGVLAGVSGNITSSDSMDLGKEVKVYRKLDEALADPQVEMVDLCTPTPLHPEQTIAALKAGRHVLCEKPLARTSATAREIVRAAKEAKGFLMPAMCMRFWPGWSLLKKVVDEKTYGKVLAARFSRLSETPAWSKTTYAGGGDSGGALFDLHIHDTDFVQFLFGRPASVFATGAQRNGSIDHVVTQYHFPDGPAVSAEGSWLLAKGFNMSFTVLCERATLDYNSDRGAEALRLTEEGKAPRVLESTGDGYAEEVRYFVDCVRNGRRPDVVTAGDGVGALEICEAEEKSVRGGRVVEV
jgi:predicted dehydrogenase